MRRWTVDEASGHVYTPGGLCLDVAGAGTPVGTPIVAWPCKAPPSDSNEKWSLVPASGIGIGINTGTGGGTVQIQTRLDGQCVQRAAAPVPHHSGNGTYLSVCGHIANFTGFGAAPLPGYCGIVHASGDDSEASARWELRFAGSVLASGDVSGKVSVGEWQQLRLDMSMQSSSGASARVEFHLNGTSIHAGEYRSGSGYGMAAIGCGWHLASFDNFKAVPLQSRSG